MMRKIINFYKRLHLNYIKEIIFVSLLNIIAVVGCISLYILFKQMNYLIILPIVFLILNACIIYRYIYLLNKINLDNLNSINDSFMYFYLEINNQIQPLEALNNVKSYSPITISENLTLLLDEYRKENSVNSFIKFANKYYSLAIEDLMVAVYEVVSNPTNKKINDFNKSFKEYINRVDVITSASHKKQYSFITLTPVISTGIVLIIVIISTVLLVRGYING